MQIKMRCQKYAISSPSPPHNASIDPIESNRIGSRGGLRLRQLEKLGRTWLIKVRIQEDDKPFQVHLSDESFETYELDPPSYTMETTKKELKRMYRDMVSVR